MATDGTIPNYAELKKLVHSASPAGVRLFRTESSEKTIFDPKLHTEQQSMIIFYQRPESTEIASDLNATTVAVFVITPLRRTNKEQLYISKEVIEDWSCPHQILFWTTGNLCKRMYI